jgi:hypothetical protein
MKTGQKTRRRRDYSVSRLADALGTSARNIKRWLSKYPELAATFRTEKSRGEWRFDYPKSESGLKAYLLRAREAAERITGGGFGKRQERLNQQVQEYIEEHGHPYTDEDRAAFVQAVETARDPASRRSAEGHLRWFDEQRQWFERYARAQIRSDQARDRERLQRIGADFDEYFGFGDEQRERDAERLAVALKRKRARMGTGGEGGWHDADFDRWEADVKEIPGTARRIAARFNCSVSEAVKHWSDHLARINEENRRRCEEERARLKERGLLKDGEHQWREFHHPSGAWAHFHLPEVKTPEQISAECERIEQLWPEAEDWPDPDNWQRAGEEIRRAWERRTLYEAALELARDNQPVTADGLCRLVFADEEHEMRYKNHWFRHEEEMRLAGLPHQWLGQDYFARPEGYARQRYERASAFHGERGISLREFWLRYTAHDVKEARQGAIRMLGWKPKLNLSTPPAFEGDQEDVVASEFDPPAPECQADCFEPVSQVEAASGQDKGESGTHLLDECGRPMLSDEDRERQKHGFVDGDTALRLRHRLQEDKELAALLAPERAAERAELEKALGVPLKTYLKKPFAEVGSSGVKR